MVGGVGKVEKTNFSFVRSFHQRVHKITIINLENDSDFEPILASNYDNRILELEPKSSKLTKIDFDSNRIPESEPNAPRFLDFYRN